MRIGVITLHRVVNYGSALQAYALQRFLEKKDYGDVELIDYIFPNAFHKVKRSLKDRLRLFYCVEIRDMYFRGKRKKIKRLRSFYNHYYHLSSVQYKSVDEIMNNPPLYDLYITGSDQLWNVNTLRNDPVPYCEFAPNGKRRISFAASFTINKLPDEFKESVRHRLDKYSHIGVREKSSLDIVNDLQLKPDITVCNTCDPTLLLGKEDYDELANYSTIRVEGTYILVYGLTYAYNPEPALSYVINEARKKFGCKVVAIESYKVKLEGHDQRIVGIGPSEFCWLFAHAKFVVTSSFHGTMFSIIYRCPFVSITPPMNHSDRRIIDILENMGLTRSYIYSDNISQQIAFSSPYNNEVEDKIDHFICDSKIFLDHAIQNM